MASSNLKNWTPVVRALDAAAAERGIARERREPASRRLNALIDEALSGYQAPDSDRPLRMAMRAANHVPLPSHWARKAS